jgi:hypothetical protein
VIRKWLILPASLPRRPKLILWAATTILLSGGAFVADYLGVARIWIIGAMVVLIVPLTAGLARGLSSGEKKRPLVRHAGA